MCQFIESIKVENKSFHNLSYHQERVNKVFASKLPHQQAFKLEELILPSDITTELYKCRIEYSQNINQIEYSLYSFKQITSLAIIEDNEIDYSHKYLDRSKLDKLREKKGDKDDILIIKDGFVTDTSYSNIVFFDGKKWLTPHTYLLAGTKRSQLLAEGKIIKTEIKREDIYAFQKAKLINCFHDLENGQEILIKNIS